MRMGGRKDVPWLVGCLVMTKSIGAVPPPILHHSGLLLLDCTDCLMVILGHSSYIF